MKMPEPRKRYFRRNEVKKMVQDAQIGKHYDFDSKIKLISGRNAMINCGFKPVSKTIKLKDGTIVYRLWRFA